MDTGGLIVAGVSLISSAAITTIVGLVIKRKFDRFFAKKEKDEAKQCADNERLKVLEAQRVREELKSDVAEIVEAKTEPIRQDLSIVKQDMAMVKKANQAGLRHDLHLMADEWLARGYCPRTVKDDFASLYMSYHQLGKNGVMDNTYQAILALPETKKEPRVPSTKSKTSATKKEKTILLE